MRPTLRAALLAISVAALPVPAAAADAPALLTEAHSLAACEAAASTFGKGDVDASFAGLATHWPLEKDEINAIAIQSRNQLRLVGGRFGEYVGIEFLRTTRAGASFHRHVYAIKYERHALRFSCAFYKPRDRWIVNGIVWDDKSPLPLDAP